tara:strand:- start:4263 stop:4610 length:348 start_codon:yes stop_codon:yes gene_type:complete
MNNTTIQFFIIGLICTQLSVTQLKKIIHQKRPTGAKSTSYGMPSKRAGRAFYIVTFLLLLNRSPTLLTKVIYIVYILGDCGFRYIDNEHSVVQLLVGGILGILFGCGFYNMSIMQ